MLEEAREITPLPAVSPIRRDLFAKKMKEGVIGIRNGSPQIYLARPRLVAFREMLGLLQQLICKCHQPYPYVLSRNSFCSDSLRKLK